MGSSAAAASSAKSIQRAQKQIGGEGFVRNNTKDIVPSVVKGATLPFALSTSLVAWLTVALMGLAAAYFLIQMRSASRLETDGK